MSTAQQPRQRLGILYPGHSAEDDYSVAQQLIGPEVAIHLVHTEMRVDAHREAALRDIGDAAILAAGAAQLGQVDSIIWACTSGSFILGWDGAQRQVEALQRVAGVPASSTSFAFVAAARCLHLRRVAVAATYPGDVAERFVEFLARAGISVLRLSSRGIRTAAVLATLEREDVLDFAEANDHPAAEAILLPDTALHTAGWLDELEARVGKTVLTANQVSLWQGLRLAGPQPGRAGLGTLFRVPAPQEVG
ncbi:MAG TPA: maleate cis-trans isomerase [Pseudonocardiaceae bacterium]|nr:maleate cis-trans isomerase [Pseudonocardiaceae bacterium]